ncbi:MAG: Fis family transcriptional regulator, partial [Rhodocyclales bacterium GWA2_65_20]
MTTSPAATPADDLPALVSFLDTFAEPRILMDEDYRIVAANHAYHDTFGAGEVLQGRHCYEVSHHFDRPCDQVGESCPLALARSSGALQRVMHLHHTPRGEEHVLVEAAPIRDAAGQPRYYVETISVVRHASSRPAGQGLVGRSAAFRRMLDRLMRVAPAQANVLLLGETGTGKEVAARVVHEASARGSGPFVAVDCSGLTETLFESELFGHEKGAFTGASHRKIGLVESARGGTLFLDEIGDVPLAMQVKLLRLLETATFRRVGGIESIGADFRLIAATHRDLAAMVHGGSFRADLYYRINTFPVRMPALAER